MKRALVVAAALCRVLLPSWAHAGNGTPITHLCGADQPLADPRSATGLIHDTLVVPNLTRVTVQGSTNKPREWLRLTIDPRASQVFSWENVVYCDDTTCPN